MGGGISPASTAGQRWLSRASWPPRICTAKPAARSSTTTPSPSLPRSRSALRRPTRSLWSWRSGSSPAARCWWPPMWMRNTPTPTSWSTPSIRTRGRNSTLRPGRWSRCGRPATSSAWSMVCPPSSRISRTGATRGSAPGSTGPQSVGRAGSSGLSPPWRRSWSWPAAGRRSSGRWSGGATGCAGRTPGSASPTPPPPG